MIQVLQIYISVKYFLNKYNFYITHIYDEQCHVTIRDSNIDVLQVKATFSVRCINTKSHNMKALIILSY